MRAIGFFLFFAAATVCAAGGYLVNNTPPEDGGEANALFIQTASVGEEYVWRLDYYIPRSVAQLVSDYLDALNLLLVATDTDMLLRSPECALTPKLVTDDGAWMLAIACKYYLVVPARHIDAFNKAGDDLRKVIEALGGRGVQVRVMTAEERNTETLS